MGKLKPWYDTVELREDLRENRPLDASEFAINLDHIRADSGPKDYIDPRRFFERTYVTGSLLDLASQVVRRLSGVQVETSAVFNMATQFGGGKSHSLAALYHLAKHGPQANTWPGVERIVHKAEVKTVPTAAVAVFVGTGFDPLSGRGDAHEPVRKTIWGEVAWQLGREQAFAVVAEHDAKGIAPGGDVIQRMLPQGPCLILMDELLNYASRSRTIGGRDQLFNFLQNLSEEARSRTNLVLCVALPSSTNLEMNPDDVRDFEAMKKLLDRLGKAIMMSADTEMAEIIRRRLFEWHGMPDEGRKTAAAYAEWAIAHAQELTGIDVDTARDKFLAAYPFHPAVLSVFERKWQSLPRFQRTRGVLRLLALWVARNYNEEHRKASREPLLTLGLAPFHDATFRSALFEQLGSDGLEIPVTTDIFGKTDAHAARLDKEADEAVKKAQLHRKVATAIFFESNGGMSQGRADASLPEIKTAVFGPDTNVVDLDNVLEGLAKTCYYLNCDRNRYRFGLTPNLNQILVTRRGAVTDKAIDERIRQQTQKMFDKHTVEGSKQVDRKYWPTRSNDIPSRPVLTLVVLGLEHEANDKKTLAFMEGLVRDCGASGRTYKSALMFAVPEAGTSVREAARLALAWEDINADDETKKRVDDGQRGQLMQNLKHAQRDLDEAIFRAYRHVYLLGKDNKLRDVDLGQINSSAAGSIVELMLRELQRSDEVAEVISSSKLVKSWPPAFTEWSTKAIRDMFYSAPQLSRLLNADSIKRTISDGVSKGELGLAEKDNKGRLKLKKFKESIAEADVEISDELFVLKVDDALKLLEPPRLASLSIKPDQIQANPWDQIAFVVAAADQYAQPFPLPMIEWAASAGSITSNGVFTTPDSEGLHTVRAGVGDREAVAQVRVKPRTKPTPTADSHAVDEEEPEPEQQGRLCWSGSVPPQKWMNFYTKVLSRLVSSPDLKLEVSFEIILPPEQANAKAADTRAGLKELGLDDDVNLS